jgi:hypothetical protein
MALKTIIITDPSSGEKKEAVINDNENVVVKKNADWKEALQTTAIVLTVLVSLIGLYVHYKAGHIPKVLKST